MKISDQNEKHVAGPHQTFESSEGCSGVSECSSENKKVTHPFLDQETGSEPCLSVLFPLADFVSGSEDPAPVQRQLSVDDNLRSKMGELRKARMLPSEREFFYNGLDDLRRETGKLLAFLVRYDDRFNIPKCRMLQQAEEVLLIHASPVSVTEEPVPGVMFQDASPHPWMDHFFFPRGGVS